MQLGQKPEAQAVVVFALSGLGAGIVSARLILRIMPSPEAHHVSHIPYLVFLWPGILFLTAIVGSFLLCYDASWPRFSSRPWRSIVAAVLVSANTFTSVWAGLFTGVAAAGLVASPSGGGPAPSSHSWLLYATPVATALVFGGLVSAFLLAVALFIFTKVWDPEAWARLALSSIAATFVTVAVNPKFLMTLRYSSAGQTDDSSLPGMLIFLVCSFMLYGGCAGYWIARTSRTDSIASGGVPD